ncbi:SDR family oxidoreductase [Sphingobium sufflavum]|uniref:SDR family NAD(P)-dependent oxidoreductase n=1 Tax=Sphingobium sufflavum TaxID=1129547 RepID=UPI001F4333E3|nr:SDR family oxidoreductase [Sphingobium sufflavum]MCE7797223.1 SDR family oxidoreductase [Sphingobium sufflavum]
MTDFTGKLVFITGGGGGIGGGMATAFAERGARLVLADIDLAHAKEEAARLPAGADVTLVPLDVSDPASWAAARTRVEDSHGPIDILCNNAGISSGFKTLLDTPSDEFDRVMAINVRGVYNGIMAIAPGMVARRSGHIVNTSSMNGLNPFGTFATYSASKFAVLGLSDAVRQELAPLGVAVSTLFPGLTRSRMSESPTDGLIALNPAQADAIRARMMDPLRVGRMVVKAIEDRQPYIITHPEYAGDTKARFEAILRAFGEPV